MFQTEKAIAVLTRLLELSKGSNDKYWLNRVMYYIERESILKYGQPVFFDDLYSMRYGPVVGIVSKGIDSAAAKNNNVWSSFVRQGENDHNTVYLVKPGNYDLLSEAEEEIIKDAFNRFYGYSFSEMAFYFHNKLPEYEQNDREQRPISYFDLLHRNGYTSEESKEIVDEIDFACLSKDVYCCRH